MHMEAFARIPDKSGQVLNAGMFIPLAIRLGMISALDKQVIGKALQMDPELLGTRKIAVNVSAASIEDPKFTQWVFMHLAKAPAGGPKIYFEFTEYSAVHRLEALKAFAEEIRFIGHGLGLDQFGQGFSNFGYLESLRPDYIKVDKSYTTELNTEKQDSRFFINALCGVAHSLNMAVIVEGVENERQWDIVQGLNVDAAQGYYLGKPTPLSGY